MKKSILIVKKNVFSSLHIKYELSRKGFKNVFLADNYHQAIQIIKTGAPDIVVVDLFLKGSYDGLHLAEFLTVYKIPFIFLLSDYTTDALKYISDTTDAKILFHPLKMKELITHINLLIQQPHTQVKFYFKNYRAFKTDFALTKKEYSCINILHKQSGVLSHCQLEKELWEERQVGKGTLRSLIRRVRDKLGTQVIETVHGFGYKFHENESMYYRNEYA